MSQFAYCAVFDEAVGQSYTAHCRGLAIVAQPFEHSRTESACKLSVFNGNDTAESLRNAFKHFCINRLAETNVEVSHAD